MTGLESLPLWPDRKVLITANGPSIQEIIGRVPENVTVVAIKDSYRHFPQARIIYGCDWQWWLARGPRSDTPAMRVIGKLPEPGTNNITDSEQAYLRAMVKLEIERGIGPLVWEGPKVRGGWNSACQIVNALARRGVKEFMIAGIDCDKPHSYLDHGRYETQQHQTDKNIEAWIEQWRIIEREFRPLGISLVNVTEGSKLDVFPRMNIYDAAKGTA